MLAYLEGKDKTLGDSMDNLIGLVGREELVTDLVAEIRKGKHVILTGPVGIGKSAVLKAALDSVGGQVELLIKLYDHQAKGQFVDMARQMLALGLLTAQELELPVKFHELPSAQIDWKDVKSQVNRMSMRDLTQAIIPALTRANTKPVIAVDDLTSLTPTQMAFWLAIFDHAQVIGCASEKKPRVRKLWWKMKEIAGQAVAAGRGAGDRQEVHCRERRADRIAGSVYFPCRQAIRRRAASDL